MSVLLDHLLRSHSKWLLLTPAQRGSLIETWMWIDEQQTDGHIPPHIPNALGIKQKDLDVLVRIGWFDVNGNGWLAHDWHDMNPPVDEVEREKWFATRRQRRRRASQRGRLRDE